MLIDCNAKLAKMPERIDSNPMGHMNQLLTNLYFDIGRLIAGNPVDDEYLDVSTPRGTNLIQVNRDTYAAFKHKIRRTAPNFIPFVNPSPEASDTEHASHPAKSAIHGQVDTLTDTEPYHLDKMRSHIKGLALPHRLYPMPSFCLFFRCVARELPNNVPFPAKERLIVDFQQKWGELMGDCFNTIKSATKYAIGACIDKNFRRFEKLRVDLR
jgi:hypothetical protein